MMLSETIKVEVIKAKEPNSGEVVELVRISDYEAMIQKYQKERGAAVAMGLILRDLLMAESNQGYCACSVCQKIRGDYSGIQEVFKEILEEGR